MARLNLSAVTLICIDDDAGRSSKALDRCLAVADFADVKLLSYFNEHKYISKIEYLGSTATYSEFCLRRLTDFFKTDFCLIIQHDGYILNPAAWRDEFLAYDYIGAPWKSGVVGNGGFSIRSSKLAHLTSVGYPLLKTDPYSSNEDWLICSVNRQLMEVWGVKFAPFDLASKFSVENAPWDGQFGFHGTNTGITP